MTNEPRYVSRAVFSTELPRQKAQDASDHFAREQANPQGPAGTLTFHGSPHMTVAMRHVVAVVIKPLGSTS